MFGLLGRGEEPGGGADGAEDDEEGDAELHDGDLGLGIGAAGKLPERRRGLEVLGFGREGAFEAAQVAGEVDVGLGGGRCMAVVVTGLTRMTLVTGGKEGLPFGAGADLGLNPCGEGAEGVALGGFEAEHRGGPFEVGHGEAVDDGAGGGDVQVRAAGARVGGAALLEGEQAGLLGDGEDFDALGGGLPACAEPRGEKAGQRAAAIGAVRELAAEARGAAIGSEEGEGEQQPAHGAGGLASGGIGVSAEVNAGGAAGEVRAGLGCRRLKAGIGLLLSR